VFSIGGIFILVAFVVWAAIFGCGLITSDNNLATKIEMGVLIGFAVIFVLFCVYVIFDFVKIEFYKKKFQHDSFKEWKALQRKKKEFAKGMNKALAKKEKPVIKVEPAVKPVEVAVKEIKAPQAETKESKTNPVGPILVNEAPRKDVIDATIPKDSNDDKEKKVPNNASVV
jgi:hypothetical protein